MRFFGKSFEFCFNDFLIFVYIPKYSLLSKDLEQHRLTRACIQFQTRDLKIQEIRSVLDFTRNINHFGNGGMMSNIVWDIAKRLCETTTYLRLLLGQTDGKSRSKWSMPFATIHSVAS